MNTRRHTLALAIGLLVPGLTHAFFGLGSSKTGTEEGRDAVLAGASSFAKERSKVLQPFLLSLWAEGERNAVLNFNRLALAAMQSGEHALAAAALDESILRIESIYADDPNAEKAKSLWSAEKVKDFKGEPYERSMVYFYRGLLYAAEGDYQNARAAFQSAERHDSLSEQERYQSDFGLMNYLAGWASFCDGDREKAAEFLERAKGQDSARFADMRVDTPYVVLIESGGAPQKTATGKHREILQFAANDGPAEQIDAVHASGSGATRWVQADAREVSSLSFQATTRGGRPVQAILDGKAQFKDTTEAAGSAAVDIGTATMTSAGYSGDRDTATAGAVIALVGLLGKAVAAATTPEADVRRWDTVGDRVHLMQAQELPRPLPSLQVTYTLNDSTYSATPILKGSEGRCGLAFVRTRSALSVADGGSASFPPTPEVIESERGTKNRAFRATLSSRFGAAPSPSGESGAPAAFVAEKREQRP